MLHHEPGIRSKPTTKPVPVSSKLGAARGTKPVASVPMSRDKSRAHQEVLLDEALEETFPASDPVASNRFE